MLKNKGKSNAQTLFEMERIPCDNHIRDLMDEVEPSYAHPVFHYILNGIKESGHLDTFRSYDNNLLCLLDATQYFSSKKIHCQNCSSKEHKNGTAIYSHTARLGFVSIQGGFPKKFIFFCHFQVDVLSHEIWVSSRRKFSNTGEPIVHPNLSDVYMYRCWEVRWPHETRFLPGALA